MKLKLLEKYNLIFLIFFVSIIFILVFNLLSLNTSSDNEDKIKKVYYADNITATHKQVIDLFNQEYKGEIKVIPINLPFTKFTTNERKELLARSLRSHNSRIDVFAIDQIWLSRFSKWAVNLDELINISIQDSILTELLFTCYHDEQLKSVPLYVDLGVLYYRKDMLKKIPNYEQLTQKIKKSLTWEEFIDINQKYFSDQPSYIFQGRAYEGLICNLIEVLKSSPEIKNDQINLEQLLEKRTVDAVAFFHDLIYKYKISPQIVAQFNEVQSYRYTLRNDVPFFRGWVSSIKDSLAFGEYYSEVDKLGFGSIPHFQGGSPKSAYGGWNLMISKTSDDKEAAATFLKFILSDRVQKIFYKKSAYLPVVKSLYGKNKIVDDYFYEIMRNHGVHRPKIENYTKYSDILTLYLNEAIIGNIKPEEAIQRARDEIDNHIKTTNK